MEVPVSSGQRRKRSFFRRPRLAFTTNARTLESVTSSSNSVVVVAAAALHSRPRSPVPAPRPPPSTFIVVVVVLSLRKMMWNGRDTMKYAYKRGEKPVKLRSQTTGTHLSSIVLRCNLDPSSVVFWTLNYTFKILRFDGLETFFSCFTTRITKTNFRTWCDDLI